jgi:hypothetical protein
MQSHDLRSKSNKKSPIKISQTELINAIKKDIHCDQSYDLAFPDKKYLLFTSSHGQKIGKRLTRNHDNVVVIADNIEEDQIMRYIAGRMNPCTIVQCNIDFAYTFTAETESDCLVWSSELQQYLKCT